MTQLLKFPTLLALLLSAQASTYSQQQTTNEKIEYVKFGNMNSWRVREVEESGIIGGQTKLLYEPNVAGDTLIGNLPYQKGSSPWRTSSVMAKVSGVVKSSTTVFPEKRGTGYAARLEARMENCKVLGLFNITVLAAGTMFLGEIDEPIKDTKNPHAKLMMGIPFTKRPKAVMFDYKLYHAGERKRIMATGFSKVQNIDGLNEAEVQLTLQNRWEDSSGNVYAKRVGTAWKRYSENSPNWSNDTRIDVKYGDITKDKNYNGYSGLMVESPQYCKNSKGVVVPIKEVGWDANAPVTHIILRFSSCHGGAYIGAPGTKLWVDNVRLVY